MNVRIVRFRVFPAVVALGAAALLAACGDDSSAQMAPPPPEVVVTSVARGEVPIELSYSGRTAGSREVELRARVSGILLRRLYEEGSAVEQGDVLFRIDPEPFRATAAQARAELGVATAQRDEARRNRDRLVPLFEKSAVSQRERDEAVSAFEVGEANVAAAQARLRTAQLELGYTEVRAPIAGLTSREARSEGSLVTAGEDSSLLTRIVQTDPLYVEFSIPESEAAMLRDGLASNAPPTVRLVLDNGTEHATPGTLTFVDNAVDTASGTVRARAVLPNPGVALLPGQFVSVKLQGVSLMAAVSLPRRAVMTSTNGSFVWVVGKGQVVELRPVVLGRAFGEQTIITEGLNGGERVVVEGVLKVKPGATVKVVNPAKPGTRTAEASPGGPATEHAR
jgi:membrane fusion protein (multidrug efflux system)